MAPRPRKKGRGDLPPNVTARKRGDDIYYGWIDPRTSKEKSLKAKNDKPLAIKRGKALNAIIAQHQEAQLISTLSSGGKTIEQFFDQYIDLLSQRGLKPNTIKSRKSLLNKWVGYVGNLSIDLVTPLHLTEAIQKEVDAGRKRQAVAMRSAAIDFFREAQVQGLFPADKINPAEIARSVKAPVTRARLGIDQLKTMLSFTSAKDQWEKNVLLLALLTGQSREDLAVAQFRRFPDWNSTLKKFTEWKKHESGPPPEFPYSFIEDGYYHATRQKTGAMIRIPLSLKLDVIGYTVGDIVSQCRDSVHSRYLIHHTRGFVEAQKGDPVHKDTVSRMFARVRNRAKLEFPEDKSPATFHEIRSLSIRLYTDQLGTKFAQTLVGHTDEETTAIYQDERSIKWQNPVEVLEK